jgi:REP element-mobilizing transposase RayT
MGKQKQIRRGQQISFFTQRHNLAYGGTLRQTRAGRGARPLSRKHALHLVFKANRNALTRGFRHPKNFALVQELFQKYARHFFVKIEQTSIQGDHIHAKIRCSKRSLFHSFFKVVAGQIAQRVTATFQTGYKGPRIWKHRPFTRVVGSWRY